MPTLSVIMIVKNEADCLRDCLESVAPVADEIVVVDTGSTDGTVEIGEAFDARVVRVAWEDDFSKARNASIQFATGDWLLHMDADEVLDPQGARIIRGLIDADGDGADAIELTLANYCNEPRSWRWIAADPADPFALGHAGYIAVPLLRLFRNRAGFEYREAVHENITESVMEQGGCIARAPVVIHHYGYAPGARSERKAAQYLELARKKTQQRPNDVKSWHDYAEQLLALGRTEESEAACSRALAIDPDHLGAASTMVTILLNRGDLETARGILERLQRAGFNAPHLPTCLAAIAIRDGRNGEALSLTDEALVLEPANVMAMLVRARALDVLGDADGARIQLETAAARVPSLAEISDRLRAIQFRAEGEVLAANGELNKALEKFVGALALDNEDPVAHNDTGVVLHLLGQTAGARESIQRALKLAPGLAAAHENLEQIQ